MIWNAVGIKFCVQSSVALNMTCYDTTKSELVNLCVTIGVTNTRESPLFAIKQMYECRPKGSFPAFKIILINYIFIQVAKSLMDQSLK